MKSVKTINRPTTGKRKEKTRLRAARESAGLTQYEMGSKVGISDSLYRRIEAGRLLPSERIAGELEQMLGKPVEWLLSPAIFVEPLPLVAGPVKRRANAKR